MRVFVVGTGRCGSYSFINACKYIDNFTAAHESRTQKLGKERFAYAENHIEADNRLSWHLAELHKHFPKDVLYVHLKRDKNATAKSHFNRFFKPKSIINAYSEAIKMNPPEMLNKEDRLAICHDYVETITTTIEEFLTDKPHITIQLETIAEDFKLFWNKIEATGNLSAAIESFSKKHNISKEHASTHWLYRLKLFVNRQIKRLE